MDIKNDLRLIELIMMIIIVLKIADGLLIKFKISIILIINMNNMESMFSLEKYGKIL